MSHNQDYKYFAFISYNQRDAKWGKRLQRKLEGYRIPTTLCSERGWNRKPLKPVFFAPTDIQPGVLNDELKERLRASRNLIVICSPNSAQSKWVGMEIEYFYSLGRGNDIHFFIVDGDPHSGDPSTECFNPIIDKIGMPEILGANINERVHRWKKLNRERAYVQLITKLLGVEFDSIWKRHRRLMFRDIVLCAVCLISVLSAIAYLWVESKPVDVFVQLVEKSVNNPDLPPLSTAVVTLQLDNETKVDTVSAPTCQAYFANIPHRYLDRHVRINVYFPDVADNCKEWKAIDTTLLLTKDVILDVYRNPACYGHIQLKICEDSRNGWKGVSGITVAVNGEKSTSDSHGNVSLTIPLNQQRTRYKINSSRPLIQDTVIMPCGKDDYLPLKQ